MTQWQKSSANQNTALFAVLGKFVCLFTITAMAGYGGPRSETLAAYQKYVGSQEERLNRENQSPTHFLWVTGEESRKQSAHQGEILIERRDAPEIPGGMIQHWIGGTFLPHTTLEQIKHIDQQYDQYAKFYAPDILQSKLISHTGNHFRVYYRFKKQNVITVVTDTIHEIDFVALGEKRLFVKSRCNHVREVENAGKPTEEVLPEDKDNGFLWAMNSYWRMEQEEDGVYVECEAITLARKIPFGLAAMIGPIVNSFAAESVTNTLKAKRRVIAETSR